MLSTLEVMDRSAGHLSLEWDPDDPESTEVARKQAEALMERGFNLFALTDEPSPFVPERGEMTARLPEGPIKKFNPKAKRTVAVPPMRGG